MNLLRCCQSRFDLKAIARAEANICFQSKMNPKLQVLVLRSRRFDAWMSNPILYVMTTREGHVRFCAFFTRLLSMMYNCRLNKWLCCCVLIVMPVIVQYSSRWQWIVLRRRQWNVNVLLRWSFIQTFIQKDIINLLLFRFFTNFLLRYLFTDFTLHSHDFALIVRFARFVHNNFGNYVNYVIKCASKIQKICGINFFISWNFLCTNYWAIHLITLIKLTVTDTANACQAVSSLEQAISLIYSWLTYCAFVILKMQHTVIFLIWNLLEVLQIFLSNE